MSIKNRSVKQVSEELSFIESLCSKIFLYPFFEKQKLQLFGYKVICFVIFLTLFQLFLSLFLSDPNDFLEIINVAPNFGVVLVAIVKFSKVNVNVKLYDIISKHFRFKVWDLVTSDSKLQNEIVVKYKTMIAFFNRLLTCYSFALIVIVNSFPFLVMMYQKNILGDIPENLYPFDGWYPFDKVKWYWVVYTWEGITTALIICVYSFLSVLHATYIGLICMELKLIATHLENLVTKEEVEFLKRGCNVNEINNHISWKLRTLISRHIFLAKISAKLDEVLGDAMLLNYTLGSVFICLTAFTCTVVDNFYKSIRYASMCASLLFDTFNQCTFGQIISDHSEKLTNAVYSCDWPNADVKTKKMIFILIMRTQKPFRITAKGLLPMNMLTFSRICSTSYQLFNLLRTIYAK